MPQLFVILLSIYIVFVQTSDALSQQDPNLNHFYMSRRQYTVEDNSPVIINKTNNPAYNNIQQGSMPNQGYTLPKASWQQYSSPINSNYHPNLPKVFNGVPPQTPNNIPNANLAHAGATKPKTKKPTNNIKTYSAYKGYGGKVSTTTKQTTQTVQTQSQNSTSTNVSGKMLHWRPQVKNF